jgi:hypothetical protein
LDFPSAPHHNFPGRQRCYGMDGGARAAASLHCFPTPATQFHKHDIRNSWIRCNAIRPDHSKRKTIRPRKGRVVDGGERVKAATCWDLEVLYQPPPIRLFPHGQDIPLFFSFLLWRAVLCSSFQHIFAMLVHGQKKHENGGCC